MSKKPLCFVAMLLCGAGGIALAPRPADALPALARDLARPLVIPSLWNGLSAASHEGSAGELAERARTLLSLVPEWGDGHVHFAALLAFEAGQAARDPERALDRLAAGIAWLEQSALDVTALAPELYASIASFVEIRCGQDEALAGAFERRFGQSPVTAADEWLARAERLVPLRSLAQRRGWLALRTIASALRVSDDRRALQVCDAALARIARSPDAADLAEWRDALSRTRAVIAGESAPATLAGVPILEDVLMALEQRRGK